MIIIMACLVDSSSCNLSQASKLRTVTGLMNDPSNKVKDFTLETLSTMVSKDPSCFELMSRMLEEEINELIRDKVDEGILP